MAGRKKTVAQTVTEVADAVSGAVMSALTPDQRAMLTSKDTGELVKLSIDLAVKVGGVIETRSKEAANG